MRYDPYGSLDVKGLTLPELLYSTPISRSITRFSGNSPYVIMKESRFSPSACVSSISASSLLFSLSFD